MCGIFSIINKNDNSNIIIESVDALSRLSNRGKDSYGLLLQDTKCNKHIIKTKTKLNMNYLKDYDYISNYAYSLGHTRYSTSYNNNKGELKFAQPFRGIHSKLGEFYLVHNGNINFSNEFKNKYDGNNDSQILVNFIENISLNNWIDILSYLLKKIPGVYNIIIFNNFKVYALKDKYSVRPLCVGKNENGYMIASESNALNKYEYLFELNPGEIVIVSDKIIRFNNEISNNLNICLFEYIYFLNKDSIMNDQNIFNFRYNFGRKLAESEINIFNNDEVIVVGSPESGIASAMGFADKLGYKYCQVIKKNKNVSRSFILKNNEERRNECSKKFILDNREEYLNKIIYFLDDSMVRGNTISFIISLLKELKPKEIHIRIPAPKIIDICKFGIDIPTKNELIMNNTSEEGFCAENNINSLKFISIDSILSVMTKLTKNNNDDICVGCFSGKYKQKLLDW